MYNEHDEIADSIENDFWISIIWCGYVYMCVSSQLHVLSVPPPYSSVPCEVREAWNTKLRTWGSM